MKKVFNGTVQGLYSTTINGLSLLVAAEDPYSAAVVRMHGDYPDALFVAPVDRETLDSTSDHWTLTVGLVAVAVGSKTLAVVSVEPVRAIDTESKIEENIDGTLRLS